jgi:uncharacterized protein (TIGR04255 family)
MATPRHLSRAPIREAVIQIQVAPRTELDLVKKFAAALSNEFAKSTDIWQATFGVQFDQENAGLPMANRLVIGKRLDSADGREVLQCNVNAFAFSRLAPYEDWGQMRDRARNLWGLYVSIVKPVSVTRVSVRYINALPIPLPVPELNDFFTAAPHVPPALPQLMRSFLQRIVIYDEATKTFAGVTQASEDSATAINVKENVATILIDIDAFQNVELGSEESEKVWTKFEELRDFKNRVFFEHITEETARLFE